MSSSKRQNGSGKTLSPAMAETIETIKFLFYGALIFLTLRVLIFQPFTIPSESMVPLLHKGDYIIVTKFDYGYSHHSIPFSPPLFKGRIFERQPKRGDVVVFKLPRDGRTDYIKRLIGLPGDRIQMSEGVPVVNGKPFTQERLIKTRTPGQFGKVVTQVRETMPGGKRYVTFDAGAYEYDDTPVYVVPEGHYFFMGDNRDNSADSRLSRESGVGFVPAENLVGKARVILFSWDEGVSIFKPWTWFTKALPKRFFKSINSEALTTEPLPVTIPSEEFSR